MRVKLADIHEEGLELSYEETPQELDLVYPDTGFEGGVLTQVRLMRVEDTVTVEGTVQAHSILQCGRCSKSFPYPLYLDFQTDFNPKPVKQKVPGENYKLSEEELDLHFYMGRMIDLGEFVREQILLALPMVPLCRPDCRGLCPVCGQDQNLEECGCVVKPP